LLGTSVYTKLPSLGQKKGELDMRFELYACGLPVEWSLIRKGYLQLDSAIRPGVRDMKN
jgi:hypothetical protein